MLSLPACGGYSVTPRVQGSALRLPGRAFPCPQPCKNRGSFRGYGQLLKAAPAAVFFRRLTMRLLSTGPLHHIAGACRSATKSGLLLRSPKDCANLILELSHPQRAAFKAVSPAKRNKTQYYFVAFVRAFYLTGLVALPNATKSGLLLRSPFVTLLTSFQ